MSEFTSKETPLQAYDAFKRVAYPFGMLLTSSEFLQEQYYFRERDELHNRLLHGYGTICGLNISVQDNDNVTVSQGLALDIQGRLIRVEPDQCASLEQWLTGSRSQPSSESPPAPPPDALYVVLCYKECPSDKVLIRTSPCRSQEQSEAHSRVQESFALKLVTEPPLQLEEETIRAFGDLLAEIQVSSGSGRLSEVELQAALEEMESLVRGLLPVESPPTVGSPPGSALPALHPADAEILFRHAFKVWVTEVKPRLVTNRTCAGSSEKDACILLAKLNINVDPQTWKIIGDVAIDESERSFFISTRTVQEYILNRSQGEALDGVTAHSALSGLTTGDDHKQYLLTNGTRALAGNLSAGNHKITDLDNATVDADALPLGQFNTQFLQHFSRNKDHPQYLLLDGSRPLNGDLKANNNKITNLKDATAAKDALNLQSARKRFVEAVAGPYRIVAAGRFDEKGNLQNPIYNETLAAKPSPEGSGIFALNFKGYEPPDDGKRSYIVKGTAEGDAGDRAGGLFHIIKFSDTETGIIVKSVSFDIEGTSRALGFMVEISEILAR